MSNVYVATETGTLTVGAEEFSVRASITRVRAGHPLLEQYPNFFEPDDVHVDYEWEQATAAPGEKRQRKAPAKAAE